jgi:hypothetical protein
VSLIDEFRQAKAKLAARSADPWRLPLERVHGKIAMTESSALPRSCCLISSKCRNAVEEPAHAGAWRN